MAEKHTEPQLQLFGRKELHLSGVIAVESFDESAVELNTKLGGLSISGSDLQVGRLDLEVGELTICGEIGGLSYGKSREERSMRHKGGRLLGRLIK